MKSNEEITNNVNRFKEKLELDNQIELLERLGSKEYLAHKERENKLKLSAALAKYQIPDVRCSLD